MAFRLVMVSGALLAAAFGGAAAADDGTRGSALDGLAPVASHTLAVQRVGAGVTAGDLRSVRREGNVDSHSVRNLIDGEKFGAEARFTLPTPPEPVGDLSGLAALGAAFAPLAPSRGGGF